MKNARIISLALLMLCGVWAAANGRLLAAGAQLSRSVQRAGKVPTPPPPIPTFVPTPVPSVKPSSVAPALIFDYKIPPPLVAQDEQATHVGYVWAADAPEPQGGSVRHDHYVAWAQGFCPGVGIYGKCPKGGPPSLPWVNRYHPDWLEWKVNKRGLPTTPARSKSNPGPILDFTNSALQEFWMSHYIAPYLKQGFSGIAWDNPTIYDPYAAAGHFDLRHHFIRQYSGTFQDIHWATAQIQAMGDFLQRARTIDPKVEFALAAPVDCFYAPMASWLLPLRYVDTIVDEEGYTFWGSSKANYIPSSRGPYCANRWLAKTDFYIQMQKAGKQLVLINQEPYPVQPYMTGSNPSARADLEWALANYFMVKYSHTYFWFGGTQQYGYSVFEQQEDAVQLGQPVGDMSPTQGVYARWFASGLALVNPSATKSFTVTLRTDKYEDLYGHGVNRMTMSPHSGIVLILRQ